MAPKGRPRVSEEVLAQRIADYCARYGVTERNASGFPAYPSGKRETPQHREWVVLFKASSRLHSAGSQDARTALLTAQNGRCPVCAEEIHVADGTVVAGAPGTETKLLVHAPCGKLLRLALELGPSAIERTRTVLWPGGGRAPRTTKTR
jgi:hypothetical protein